MSATILIVDDEEIARTNIGTFLTERGYETFDVSTIGEAQEFIDQGKADIVLLDAQLPDGFGPTFLADTASMPLRPPMIMITAFGDIEMAVEAMKNGAHDFLQKPIKFDQLETTIQRAEEIVAMKRELAHLRRTRQDQLDFIVGDSQTMNLVVEQAQRAAEASVSVLITGETGTGKEVLAHSIHQMGSRIDKPFIPINCAAIQSTVLESELFGYEPGAFTGAEKRKLGLMEIADGGILFLDEISSMPVDMQAKLLRAIEDHSFRRVGGTNEIKVDVQILAASNRDLKVLMETGMFREDLYYRLKVVDLHLPPLDDRSQDIPELVGLFIKKANQQMGKNVIDVNPKSMQALKIHNWPGNIRELKNIIERAVLFCDGPTIELSHLPAEITNTKPASSKKMK